MAVFSEQDTQLARERATRDIAQFKPTGFWQNAQSAWNDFNNNDQFGSLRNQRRKADEDRIATIEKLTGQKLDTPWNRFGSDNVSSNFLALQSQFDRSGAVGVGSIADAINPFQMVAEWFDGVDNDLSEPERLKRFDEEIDRIRATLPPEQAKQIPTRDEIEAQLKARAAELTKTNADIASRAELSGIAGQFAGGSAAALTQPEVALTLPIGAPARAGLVSKMLIEAGIAGGVESVLQPGVQGQRAELGLEAGFSEAAQNVAIAAAGAGAFTGVLGVIARGGTAAFEKLAGRKATADEAALIHQLQRDMDAEAQAPYEARTAAAQRVQLQNEQAGYEAALEGRMLGEEELSEDSDAFAVRDIETSSVTILRNDDLDSIGVDAKLMQFKAGGDEQGVTDRLQGVTKWEPERAGIALIYEFEDGSRIIADGHQRLGLARRLAADGQEIEMHAIVLRESDGITAAEARARAAFKNIAEGTGTAQDAAKVLRDMGASPEDMGLPPKSALVRDAEGLVKLDDETFGMVINDILSEQFGAIIGRLVEDPRLQPEIARLLVKLKPANAAEADSIVRQALEAGATREVQDSLFGEEEIVQSLFLEKARVLDRGMKMIRRNIDTFRTLNDRGDDIAGAGNVLNESENARRLRLEKTLKDYLQAQAHRKGVIGDALTEAASKAKETGQYAGPAREFVEAVTRSVESGAVDGDAVSRAGLGSDAQRQGAETPPEQQSGFEQVTDEDLKAFSDPVGAATEEQATALLREMTDVPDYQPDSREALAQALKDGATGDEIDNHPTVQKALQDMIAVPRTDEVPEFGSDKWRASRLFNFNGEEVRGVDEAEERLYNVWEGLAYTDDGLEPPANPVRYEKQATIILGPPAAGKSTIANPIARAHGAMIIDSDEVKKVIPEYQGGIGANAVHEESGVIMNEVLSRAMDDGANVVIPKVGHSSGSIEKIAATLKADGYTVQIVNMRVDADEAYARMIQRFVKTGRLVPPGYVRTVGNKPTEVFAQLQKKGVADGYSEIDNNGGFNDPKPVLKDDGGFVAKAGFGLDGARGQDGGSLGQPARRSEETAAGQQTLIDGVEPITDADRLRTAANAPMRGGDAPADDGLFDLVGRGQGDLLDLAIPTGERIDADGSRVTETQTVRGIFDQLEEDQEFVEQLALCDGKGIAAE